MVVFFDIDGTIIDDSSQIIPESTRRAVEKLRENGHIAVINTGRPYSHIDPRVREMAFRGWVCGCGMEVMLDDTWLHRLLPDENMRRFAVRCAEKYRMMPVYETVDGGLRYEKIFASDRWVREESDRMRNKGFFVELLEKGSIPEFMKFVAFSREGSDPIGFTREMECWFTVIDRGSTMLEIINKGCSKAAGMQAVLDRLGVDRSQTLAIGDSTNDLPMFSLAEHTVCMGGGQAEVKQAVEYVTDTVMNGGIEKALRHYGLI